MSRGARLATVRKPVGKGGINGCQAVPRVGSPGDLWGRPLRRVESPWGGRLKSPKVGVGWQLNNGNCKFPPLVRTGPGATYRVPSRGPEMLLLEGWQEGLV